MEKHKLFKTFLICALLVSYIVLSSCGMNKRETPKHNIEQGMSIQEVADRITDAAKDYNKNIDQKKLLDGISQDPQTSATKLHVLVMASRGFGELPEKTGKNERLAAPEVDYSAVEDWAKPDIEKLSKAGLLDKEDWIQFIKSAPGLTPPNTQGIPANDAVQADVVSDTTPEDAAASPTESSGASDFQKDTVSDSPTNTDETQTQPSEKDLPSADQMPEFMNIAVNEAYLNKILNRFYSYFATNLKDDFYATVNKNEADGEMPKGVQISGGTENTRIGNDKKIEALILEIARPNNKEKNDYEKNTPEQKISTMFNNYMNHEERDKQGLAPLQPYVDKINDAKSVSELFDTIAEITKEIGIPASGLIGFNLNPSMKDTTINEINLIVPYVLPREEETDSGDAAKLDFVKKQLLMLGNSEESATEKTKALIDLEQQIYSNLYPKDGDIGKISTEGLNAQITNEELAELLPEANILNFFKSIGFSDDFNYVTNHLPTLKAHTSVMKNDNLEALKVMQTIAMIGAYRETLSSEVESLYRDYYEMMKEDDTEEKRISQAAYKVSIYLTDEVGKKFVERYFSPKAKADLLEMSNSIINGFKEIVNSKEWLSDEAKQEAIKKLDNINVLIGYPDEWPTSNSEIISFSDNGSLFQNVASVLRSRLDTLIATQKEPRKHDFSTFPVTLSNAAAQRQTNTILFPAAVLQPPLYDENASFEENLAGIGTVIAHELTHAFDDEGAKYDVNGNYRDWWSEEDRKNFEELTKKVEDFFDGYEVATGIKVNGKYTLSENIADMGGIAGALQVLKQKENPDYDLFFKHYAEAWSRVYSSHEFLKLKTERDEHSPAKARVNRVLQNFQEFYDTYDIKEGDGMWIPENQRVRIW